MTLYLKHFGMREAPFKITPTTEFFYGGGRRGEILYALQYAIEVGEGIMMVTGEVGSGKTMLLRTLEEKMPASVELVYIANPSLSGREIVYHICEELGLDIDTQRPDAIRRLQNYLIERHAQGRRVIVFIDEAQAMPDESLEEIRLLSNLETSRHKLLQVAMFGQPELLDKLSRQNMRQLRERITVALTLEPFNREDVQEYISTRLHAAGYNGGQLFSKDGCQLLAAVSQGLSRRINVLADKSMLSAFERNADKVLYEDVRRAVKDAKYGRMRYRSEHARRLSRQLTVWLTFAACGVLAVAIFSRGETSLPSPTPAPLQAEAVAVAEADSAADAESNPDSDSTLQNNDSGGSETVAAAADSVLQNEEQGGSAQNSDTIAAVVEDENAGDGLSEGERLLSAIIALESGDKSDKDEIAREIAQAAEAHAPPGQKAPEGWESKAIRSAGLVDNEKWGWMPEASYLRGRLNATQTWLQKNGGKGHTARLLTVGQERGVFLERFLRHFADFYPLRNLMVYPLRLGEGDKFVVTFGVYSSREDADIYIRNMPRYFVGGRPFSQPLADSISESAGHW